MKKIFLALGLVATLLVSCGKREAQEKLVNQKAMQDSIQAVLDAKNREMEDLFAQLNEIEQDLNTVTSKYSNVESIRNASTELNKNNRSKIQSQIQDINEILNQQKQRINALTNELKKTQSNNKELTAFIEKLQKRITEQEEEIQLLTTELQKKNIIISSLNKNLDDLTQQNKEKDDHILKVEDEKNTVYYIVGTKKELVSQGIINSKGGFLGIGKKTSVSSDSELSKYQTEDLRRLKSIKLNGKKVQILTAHPSSSYSLDSEDKPTQLIITNASLFWSKSKFLVVMEK
ncbi:MAG: hypothetical protein Q4Q06_03390 [Bacteroidota bacterium]|nr:hypothetical protein [Bacteroidota bacterium]